MQPALSRPDDLASGLTARGGGPRASLASVIALWSATALVLVALLAVVLTRV